jgi:hypothetical protein
MADTVKPTIDELAALLRARTVDRFGNEAGTFNENTRPTATEAQAIIDSAYDLVSLRIGPLPDGDELIGSQAKSVILLLAARLVETVYYPEQAAQDQSAAELYGEMYDDAIRSLESAVADNRATTTTGFFSSIPMKGIAASSGHGPWPINPEQRDLDEPVDPYDPAWTPSRWRDDGAV